MGKIRIIGGHYRGRKLTVIDADGLRPTLDRVKETLFNWLGQDLTNLSCLDLFAGSGSLAFEAISRNASNVTLVEANAQVAAQLKHNLQVLKVTNVTVVHSDAISYLHGCNAAYDIIFVDPPYASTLLAESLPLLAKVLNENGVIFIENYLAVDLAEFKIIKHGTAGKVNYALLSTTRNEECHFI